MKGRMYNYGSIKGETCSTWRLISYLYFIYVIKIYMR